MRVSLMQVATCAGWLMLCELILNATYDWFPTRGTALHSPIRLTHAFGVTVALVLFGLKVWPTLGVAFKR